MIEFRIIVAVKMLYSDFVDFDPHCIVFFAELMQCENGDVIQTSVEITLRRKLKLIGGVGIIFANEKLTHIGNIIFKNFSITGNIC